MVSFLAGLSQRAAATSSGEWDLRRVRPVTLLIASGIVLIAAILIVTGVIAGRLHDQAVASIKSELVQLDAIVAEANSRSFGVADAVLQSLSDRLRQTDSETVPRLADAMTTPEDAALIRRGLGPASPFVAIALIGPNGSLLNTTGWWPSSAAKLAERDIFAQMHARPQLDRVIGVPIVDPHSGARLIPMAQRVVGNAGETIGFVVGALPASTIETFFKAVPLDAEGTVVLRRHDGIVLAQYPQPTETAAAQSAGQAGSAADETAGGFASWRISATRNLPGYPLSVTIARSADLALRAWSGQAVLLGALALSGALGVGLMMCVIARQFRIYAALTSVRAQKIEADHARLLTEAELLKKERLSVLGQLTATVAHELRNPLSAIRNTLFSVKEMATGAALKLDRPIARMERSIDRCNRIIGDLLEYARIRELKCTQVNFEAWLREVLVEQAMPAPISMVEEFHATGAMVSIDADRVRRVVINLIDNAAQALGELPADSSERRITVRTLLEDDMVELAIVDTGPGIPPENRPRIFEPLFSTKNFGTGLGLATVKQIVAQHNGTIEVESEVGRGTCFSVRLPRDKGAKATA